MLIAVWREEDETLVTEFKTNKRCYINLDIHLHLGYYSLIVISVQADVAVVDLKTTDRSAAQLCRRQRRVQMMT